MSILIKGMGMPKGCGSCPCWNEECFGAYKCEAVKSWGSDTERASGCPIIEVPEPHGRLIDTDAVTLEGGPYEYDDWCKWALEQYQDAPTVIPASEGE